MKTRNVTVYCAASNNVKPEYLDSAEEFGRLLAQNGCGIIYGGGRAGLMGRLADGALKAGGHVTGIIPEFMVNLELENKDATILHRVADMHERQKKMAVDADCIVALPGGSGTMTELFEAISWKRLGLIIPPIIIVNLFGFYNPLIDLLDKMVNEKFMAAGESQIWHITESATEASELICRLLPE